MAENYGRRRAIRLVISIILLVVVGIVRNIHLKQKSEEKERTISDLDLKMK
jgi:hypothetical protein